MVWAGENKDCMYSNTRQIGRAVRTGTVVEHERLDFIVSHCKVERVGGV